MVQKPTWYYRNLVYKSSDIYPWFTKVECFEFLRGFSCFLGCSQNSHTDTSAHLFLIEKNCTTKKICRVFFTYFYFARTYVQKSPNHSHNATFFSQRSIFKILAMAWKKCKDSSMVVLIVIETFLATSPKMQENYHSQMVNVSKSLNNEF